MTQRPSFNVNTVKAKKFFDARGLKVSRAVPEKHIINYFGLRYYFILFYYIYFSFHSFTFLFSTVNRNDLKSSMEMDYETEMDNILV